MGGGFCQEVDRLAVGSHLEDQTVSANAGQIQPPVPCWVQVEVVGNYIRKYSNHFQSAKSDQK